MKKDTVCDDMFSLIKNFINEYTYLPGIVGIERIAVNLLTLEVWVTTGVGEAIVSVIEPDTIKLLFVDIQKIMKNTYGVLNTENIFMVDISTTDKSFIVKEARVTHHK